MNFGFQWFCYGMVSHSFSHCFDHSNTKPLEIQTRWLPFCSDFHTFGIPAPNVNLNFAFYKIDISSFQISNGGNVTRIVELFRLDFDDVIKVKPQSIGEVHLINVKQGVISDNTCRSDPCLNGGTCHVTWNDYRYVLYGLVP